MGAGRDRQACQHQSSATPWRVARGFRSTLSLQWRLHFAWMYGKCAHEQHVRRTITLTLTLTHTITPYSVGGNVVRVRILICATRQKPCRKRVYRGFQTVCRRRLKTTPFNCIFYSDSVILLSAFKPTGRITALDQFYCTKSYCN